MAVATFDTLKYANTLKAAGVPDKQAEAQAVVLSDMLQVNLKDLVTKDDLKVELKALKDEIKADIREMELRIGSRLDLAEQRHKSEQAIIRWMLGFSISLGIAIAVRLFFYRGGF